MLPEGDAGIFTYFDSGDEVRPASSSSETHGPPLSQTSVAGNSATCGGGRWNAPVYPHFFFLKKRYLVC